MKIQNQYHQDMMKLIHRIDELYSLNATCNFNELPQEYRSSLHSIFIQSTYYLANHLDYNIVNLMQYCDKWCTVFQGFKQYLENRL